MTSQELRSRLKHIESIKNDEEAAHISRDLLWRDVLQHLADGGNDLAALALRTEDIEFARWYA